MTAAAGRKITVLRGDGVTLADAADEFLSTHLVASPNTHRAYASAIDRTITAAGVGTRRLADVGASSRSRSSMRAVEVTGHRPAGRPSTGAFRSAAAAARPPADTRAAISIARASD